MALAGAALTVMLALSGCGASLDRDVDVQGMTLSVPSNWAQEIAEGNTDAQGTVTFEKATDDEDDPYNAIVARYEAAGDETPADADAAIALKQQELESEQGVVRWSIDDENDEIIDGAYVTTYEYSFDKEIDHVSKTYEYKTAYVFDGDMAYEISVYGDEAAIGDVVGSIELA